MPHAPEGGVRTLMDLETTPSGTDARQPAPVLALRLPACAFITRVSHSRPAPGRLLPRSRCRAEAAPRCESYTGFQSSRSHVGEPAGTRPCQRRGNRGVPAARGLECVWHDAHGGAIKGPGVWRMNLTRLLQPRGVRAGVRARRKPRRCGIGFAFGGKAGISPRSWMPQFYEVTEHGAAATYIVRAAGKSHYLKSRCRAKRLRLSWPVRTSARLALARETTPEILLTGSEARTSESIDAAATCRIHGLLDDGGEISDALRRNSPGRAHADASRRGLCARYRAETGRRNWERIRRGLYGVQELGERLRLEEAPTPSTFVMDWPTLRLRMVHQLLTWQETLKEPRAYYMR